MSMLNAIGSYDDIWKAIICPNKQEYNICDLGPTDMTVQGNKVRRTDFRLLNKRGFSIQCSYFQQVNITTAIPCVVYLHANGCSRLEALQYLDTVLSNPVSFFCFDFSGCGKSDGIYTSVGWYEQDDLECVVQYLYNTGKVSKIAVWGRSMGSITALMYASKDPRIDCLIFDSPFANFKRFVKELVKEKAPIPEFLVTGAFEIIRTTIKKKANFDIDALKPVKYVDKIAMPALFGAAKDDIFVSNQHTKDLFKAYGGHKQLMIFEGDHNSQRPPNWTKLVKEFLRFHLLGEKHESQIPKKSIKNLFNAAEKHQEPHAPATTLGVTHNVVPSNYNTRPVSAAVQPPQQNNMNFTWLNTGASSPTLSGSQTTQSSISTDTVNRRDESGKKLAEKKLSGLFSPQSPVQQHNQQSSSQYGYDYKNTVMSHTERVHPKQDSPRLASRGYIGHINAKSHEHGVKSPSYSGKSIAEVQSNVNMFAFKENKTKHVSALDGSLNHLDSPKTSISLKDASSYHLNNPIDHSLNNQKSKRKIFGPSNSQARSPQSMIPSVSVSLSKTHISDSNDYKLSNLNPNPSHTTQRRMDSQRDRSRKIFEKAGEPHSTSNIHTVRPASSKSFTAMVTMPDQRVVKEISGVRDSNKKGLYLDVHSNLNGHLVAPVQTVPNAQISYTTSGLGSIGQLDARRISDNHSNFAHYGYSHDLLVRNNGART